MRWAIRVQRTDTGTSDALWHRWGAQTGLEREEYDTYLANSSQPCAIVVDAVTRFAGSVGLPELRDASTRSSRLRATGSSGTRSCHLC